MSDAWIELGDGVCDFEQVLLDQLCPSAKKKLTASTVFVTSSRYC